MAIRTTANMTPAGTTHYLYDLQGHLLVEADGTGQTLREYVWLGDTPLALVADVNTASPKLYWVHADQVNRPLRMTDASEAVVWDAVYRPFGDAVSIAGPAANNLRFPGQYFLIEDGLHYNWYRQYDPTLGRYVQADPFRDVLSAKTSAALDVFDVTNAVLDLTNAVNASPRNFLEVTPHDWINKLDFPESKSGPNLYAYARSAPIVSVDKDGLVPIAPYSHGNIGSIVEQCTQNCANAHRLCIASGRPSIVCLKALYNCSILGLPTIFGPGIVGIPR